ncbi:hypothetical protein CBS101457_003147 [Exobasidium rhododendri]|nr:hypothetical protein CBS101457_003147 [Exobasidium rhododendri]
MPTFSCQRCRQALKLPSSLSDDTAAGGALTQSAYDVIEAESILLRQPASTSARKTLQSAAKPHATVEADQAISPIAPSSLSSKEENLVERPEGSRNLLSNHLALTTSLFELLSKTTPPPSWVPPTDPRLSAATLKLTPKERNQKARLPIGENGALTAAIDHPLCSDCTNVLLTVMEGQLDEVRRERDAYIAFDEELRSGEDEKTSREAVTLEIKKLVIQATETKAELEAAKEEEAAVEADLLALDEEEKRLEEEERQFWQSYTALSRNASELSAQRSSLQASLSSERAQLTRLQSTNVYNDAFCIGYEDGYGTINGLRLGRLQNDATSRGGAVEWTEVNAAWGQTALLLVTLARKVDLTFINYKVVPMGSFSAVEKVGGDRKEVYMLHGSSDWQLGRLLPDRRFDHGMIAFLDCLRQLCEHVAVRDTSFKSPHIINKDKIGGSSIRKSDEVWTRALRNVLMTLKMLLSSIVTTMDAA